ncbi:MAG: PaaI family thioesterase [Pseudomonadota bacterium]|uniref:PaaI family thioesterase n=1 Tax=Pseudooceanicola nitratireducens TaxID=517719 RepID=UPI0021BC28BC|nr:PaaI family thioesterase [Pseudooceanicola nitratireducens]MEC7297289.1 PaaI family thioesterase [Pseudomonadota bacterium]MEC7793192.1 PaaI family thioesterase [Pseudomonadota bacterium]MEC8667881.1 PaaI family thioesterase [Pseudomonadota bacterium]MEC9105377.1 PaaI family thioesterase [Pseudomonadota bacterium]
MSAAGPVMTTDELNEFLAAEFPQVRNDFLVEEVRPMGVRVRLKVEDKHLRPGGTVSGPTMFALADVAVYLGVLGMIGPKGLAVTTNCSMDFMRKPAAATDLVADCTILKLGRVLAVGDVMIRSDGQEAPVARATMTYSIPPERAPQG